MNDCSKCKFSEEDYIFDEEIGEEYPFYICSKGNDTSLDYELKILRNISQRNIKKKIQSAINVSILRFASIRAMLLIVGRFAIQEVII